MFDAEPEGWNRVTLADCLDDFRNGWTYDARAIGGTLPITRIETISNGDIDYEKVGLAQPDHRMEAFRLRKNDILFSHINSVEHIAKVAMKRDDAVLYHGMNLMRLRPNHRVDPEFLFARLRSNETREHFRASCKRAVNQASLNKGEIGGYIFLLPPIEEQQRIAEVLRSLDNAILLETEFGRASEKTLDYLLGEMIPAEIADTEEGWSQVKVGEFSTVVTGKTPSTKDAALWGGEIQFVTPTDMNGTIRSVRAARTVTEDAISHTKIAPKNSVLFTCIASIGKLCLNTEPVAFNQQINACICDDATDAEFLYWSLRRMTPRIRSMCGTTAVPIINKRTFSDISFPIPPMAKRAKIAEILSQMGRLVEASADTLASLRSLQERIASDLLSGCVRVPT